jgi:hypothetical protein
VSPCRCGRIMIDREAVGARNWNPDCPEHGTHSEWWSSPEQVERRGAQSAHLRDLQAQARAARQEAQR